jgi:hypothetical protein
MTTASKTSFSVSSDGGGGSSSSSSSGGNRVQRLRQASFSCEDDDDKDTGEGLYVVDVQSPNWLRSTTLPD